MGESLTRFNRTMPYKNPETGETISKRALYQKTVTPDHTIEEIELGRATEPTRLIIQTPDARETWILVEKIG